MYLADYHTHTRLSIDSQADPHGMARAAWAAGLRELCFTDHVDLIDGAGRPQDFVGWAPYAAQFRQVTGAAPSGLTFRLGLELGEAWERPERAAEITSYPALDFVIGSVHNRPLAEGGADLSLLSYPTAESCHAALRSYFNAMEVLAAMDCFDVLGHIIYPLRYMNRRDGNSVTLEGYFPQLERIFCAAIGKDKGIELNTCRGETVEDWRPILALYRDCGGCIVTLGSDAHRPQDLAKGLPQAAELLKEFGFGLAVYEKRQPNIIKL